MVKKNPHVNAYVTFLETENRELKKQVAELQDQITDLKEQVNSIKSYIFKPNKKESKPRKLGPPKNHKPNNRPIPTEIHIKERLTLQACPCCGGRLSKPMRTRKRYKEDIRPPEQMNTEYEIPLYHCKTCKRQVEPMPIDVIPKCRFGIRFMLLVTFLRYGMLLPYNKIAKQMLVLYGMRISEGCLVDSISRFAQYAGPEFDNIKQRMKELNVVHTDWTGWRVRGNNTTLWDFVDREYSLLVIRQDRSKAVVDEVLGEKRDRVVISDCMSATERMDCMQQKCWVHFLRFTRNLNSVEGIRLHRRLKRIHRDAKSGEFTVERLLERINSLKRAGYREKKSVQIINRLDKYRDALFVFVGNPDVSDNNNEAERGLRQSVVMRKITGGNRSDRGVHNHEVIMSVMNTWDKQGRDFFSEGMSVVQENMM